MSREFIDLSIAIQDNDISDSPLTRPKVTYTNTRAGSRYGYEDYINTGCGMGREATMYLLERGIRVVGTDAWGWDVPILYTSHRSLTIIVSQTLAVE